MPPSPPTMPPTTTSPPAAPLACLSSLLTDSPSPFCLSGAGLLGRRGPHVLPHRRLVLDHLPGHHHHAQGRLSPHHHTPQPPRRAAAAAGVIFHPPPTAASCWGRVEDTAAVSPSSLTARAGTATSREAHFIIQVLAMTGAGSIPFQSRMHEPYIHGSRGSSSRRGRREGGRGGRETRARYLRCVAMRRAQTAGARLCRRESDGETSRGERVRGGGARDSAAPLCSPCA